MASLIRTRSGIYYIVSSVNRKRVWRSTGTRIRATAYRIYLNRLDPALVEHQKWAESPLGEIVRNYLIFVEASLAPKTREIYENTLAHLLTFLGNQHPLAAVTNWELDQYKVYRARRVKPSTVNIELRSIKTFFNTLKRWEMVSSNPCTGVALVRVPDVPPCYLSKEKIPVLIGAIREQWLKEIVLFALMSGARLGEILNLRWEDVDIPNRTVCIRSWPVHRVKGGKLRILPLNSTLVEMLKARTTREGLVFKGKRGKQANPNFVSQKFREVVRSLGFDRGIHFHSLRHTFASLLVKSGVSLYKVQKLLGHSSSRVTEVYAYLQPSEMHDVVGLLSM